MSTFTGTLALYQDRQEFRLEFPFGALGPQMYLTPRDEQILWTLTHRLRLMSVRQVARTWWPDSQQARAAARLRQLANAGLVEVDSVMAHPEIELSAPVLSWRPGEEVPDFGAVAYRLKARWTRNPVSTSVVHATEAGVGMFGGYTGGRGPRPSETTHDLHLAQVFLSLKAKEPQLVKRWVSENELYADGRGRNERLPDAIIRGRRSGEPPVRIIEFGGAYSKAKLAGFHESMSEVPYEIW